MAILRVLCYNEAMDIPIGIYRKGVLIATVILAAAAIPIFFGSFFFALHGFNLRRSGARNYERNTYEISGDFAHTSIDESTARISFSVSEGETCKIECFERRDMKHSSAVQDGTLFIFRNPMDTRERHDRFGIRSGGRIETMVICLPKTEYGSLHIETDTGDVEIPDGFHFQNSASRAIHP